jgi:hypothetical protein
VTGPPPLPTERVHNVAVGQVTEWLVWSALVVGSSGDLHVFLPLDDRGIDGIVHRISTDGYARVQVKGHGAHTARSIVMQVPEGELLDDRAVIVAVNVDLGTRTLGSHAVVIDVPAFRELATRNQAHTEVLYEAQTLVPPPPGSPWARWCVPVEEIGTRLLPGPAVPAVALPSDWVASRRLGYRAEMELLRRAADCETLNVFKAFPDLEPNEYLLYETESREILGIQVKSVSFAPGTDEAHVSVYRPALRPSPRTWFVIFLADRGETAFLPDCAVIPSAVVAEDLGGHRIDGGLAVTRRLTGRLAPWRVPLADLGDRLAEVARVSPGARPSG